MQILLYHLLRVPSQLSLLVTTTTSVSSIPTVVSTTTSGHSHRVHCLSRSRQCQDTIMHCLTDRYALYCQSLVSLAVTVQPCSSMHAPHVQTHSPPPQIIIECVLENWCYSSLHFIVSCLMMRTIVAKLILPKKNSVGC